MSIDSIDSSEGPFDLSYTPESSLDVYSREGLALGVTPVIGLSRLETVKQAVLRRAIVDVGSGGTKYLIADYNLATGQYTVVKEGRIKVPYQRALNASEDHLFGKEIREEGIAAFQEIQNLFSDYGVQQSFAFATEAFRQADNAMDFVHEIGRRSGINVRIFEQKDEAAIAFAQAAEHLSVPEENLVVLEIGTGSFQLSIKDERAHMGDLGSVPFNHQILKEILDLDPAESGNLGSLTDEQVKQADKIARDIARKAEKEIKNVIQGDADRSIVGIGNLFTRSLAPHAKNPDVITRSDIRKFIREILKMPSDEIKNDPFLGTDLSNASLALGFMKALQIHEINVLDSSNTTTILQNEANWS